MSAIAHRSLRLLALCLVVRNKAVPVLEVLARLCLLCQRPRVLSALFEALARARLVSRRDGEAMDEEA